MHPITDTYFSRNLSENELNYFGKKQIKLITDKPDYLNVVAWQSKYDPKFGFSVDSLVTQTAYCVGFNTDNCPVPRGCQIVMKQINRIDENKVLLQKWVYAGGFQTCPKTPTQSKEIEFEWDEDKAKEMLRKY